MRFERREFNTNQREPVLCGAITNTASQIYPSTLVLYKKKKNHGGHGGHGGREEEDFSTKREDRKERRGGKKNFTTNKTELVIRNLNWLLPRQDCELRSFIFTYHIAILYV